MNTSKLSIAGLWLLLPAAVAAQHEAPERARPDTAAYRVFTGEGLPATLDDLLAATTGIEVLLLGEAHTDPVGHQLQVAILNGILQRETSPPAGRKVILSMEMFERDIQYVVDEYLAGLITEDQFRKNARPWPHYQEDYHILFETARGAGVRVVAANAPRRYINLVGREGPAALNALSEMALRSLAPLPYAPPSAAYRAELDEVMGQHGDSTAAATTASENGLWAQSLWDATMAFSIAEALLHDPEALVVHVVGSFHVKNATGIPEQLERYRPGTKRMIVFVDPVADFGTFDEELTGTGDFVIQTDKSLERRTAPPSRAGG